tara:strand:- start:2966 stop:3853 length:888 start_codon:yes stop_codon:yes gene_type:complete
MRVLLIGKNGQVGRHVCKLLSDQANISLFALNKKDLDITNKTEIEVIVKKYMPEIIINAAAYTAVDSAESEVKLAHMVNCSGAKFLAEASESLGATFFHISTDYVFSGNEVGSYKETDDANPVNVYGASKLAGEIAVLNACKKHIIIRTSWVFSEFGSNFVKTMLQMAGKQKTLNIVNDQIGGPTFAGDIAHALKDILLMIDNGGIPRYGIYHYSGMPHVSWYEFANQIFDEAVEQEILSHKPKLMKIDSNQHQTAATRPKDSRLNLKKIKNQFSIQPSDWKAALHDIKLYMETL